MQDLLSIAAEFYKNFPNIQPLFPEQKQEVEKVQYIIGNSPFLSQKQREKLQTIVKFLGLKTLQTIGDSFIRQNLRFLVKNIKQHQKNEKK